MPQAVRENASSTELCSRQITVQIFNTDTLSRAVGSGLRTVLVIDTANHSEPLIYGLILSRSFHIRSGPMSRFSTS